MRDFNAGLARIGRCLVVRGRRTPPGAAARADRRRPRAGAAAASPVDGSATTRRRHPYLFTTLEIALVLAGGNGLVLPQRRRRALGVAALEWRAWKRKMTAEDVTFDSDHFNTNAVGHPMDGTAYYQIARGNGLGPAGVVHLFGPRLHVLGVLRRDPRTPVAQRPDHDPGRRGGHRRDDLPAGAIPLAQRNERSATARAHLCSRRSASINDRPICRVRPGALLPWAKLGFRPASAGRSSTATVVREQLAVAVGSEMVTQRAYERPGSGSGRGDAGPVDLALSRHAAGAATTMDGLWFHAQTVWGGRYDRNFRAAGDETDVPVAAARPRGWGTMLGLGSSSTIGCAICRRCTTGRPRSGWGGRCSSCPRAARVSCASRCPPNTRSRSSGRWRIARISALVLGQTIKTPLRYSGYYYAHG